MQRLKGQRCQNVPRSNHQAAKSPGFDRLGAWQLAQSPFYSLVPRCLGGTKAFRPDLFVFASLLPCVFALRILV